MTPRAWLHRYGAIGAIGLCLAGTVVADPLGATAAGVAPLPIGSTVLRYGDAGPSVRVLQGDLRQFGLDPGPVNGVFDGQTAAALLRFQRSHHIHASGVLDAATFRQVLQTLGYGGAAPAGGGAGSTQTAKADSGTGTQAPSPGSVGQTSGAGAPTSSTGAGAPTAPSGTSSAQARPLSAAAPAPRAGHPEILAYWAVWGSNASELSDLRQNATAITWLSPYWYTLRGDGTLRSRETDHAQVVSAAHASNVPVLALVNQGAGVAALLSTASGRTEAVDGIAGMLQSNPGVTGVVIDFEQLPATSRADLTAFVQQLRSTLPHADTVGVAVMPKASDPGPSYAQVFDYAALGQAANFVQLMTYDRHSDGGPAGPVSPNNWVAQVAQYAATVIPPGKVLIGVPGYGYDWVSGTTSAATVDTTQAIATAAAHGVTPTYDPTSGEDHYTYTDGGGTQHTVWYESAQGVAGKYGIVRQQGLGGMALWTIGGEQPAFWPAATSGQG